MKYWASNITVIPLERDSCPAPAAMVQDSEWLSFGLSAGTRCGERPRRLFLQLLFGSILLIAGAVEAQASGAVYKCMRVHVYTSGPGVDAGSVQIYRTSNIEHQTAIAKKGGHAFALCHILQSESPHSFLHPFTPSLLSSNGALLAHHTTSIKPLPAARNGVAARTPLPEAGEHSKKMISHFQICTEGYLARPGIPVPASGLFIQPPEPERVKVEKCKGVKGCQPPSFSPISTTHNRQQYKPPPCGYPEKTRGEPSFFHSLHPSKCLTYDA